MLAIALGSLWRFGVNGGGALIASTLVAGTGVAVVQALAPGVVKRWYSANVPLAMGVYSAALMTGGGLAATVSPIVAEYYGRWQWGLGVFAVPAVLAILLWNTRPADSESAGGKGVAVGFFSNRRAWLLAGYFGLANGGYACMIAWLPSFAQELGWSAQDSGDLIGIMTIFQVMAALGAPALAAGRLDRRPWLLLAVVLQLVGFSGLVWLPDAALTLWVALIGAGLGACFSLTLTVALDHLSHPGFAGALTAFVQGIGFMITAAMPYLAGMLHEVTGGFQSAWVMLLITLVMMLAATFRFNPSGYSASMGQLQAS